MSLWGQIIMELNTNREIVNVDGFLIERDVLNVVERIKAYDPNLEVLCLDPNKADFADAPFIVAERCKDGQLRRVFEVWELDERVLERVWLSDTQRHDVQTRLEKNNQAARENSSRKFKEERDEAKDVVAHIFASAKGTYTWRNDDGALVQINDDPTRKPITHAD